jgi:hypothetical protein
MASPTNLQCRGHWDHHVENYGLHHLGSQNPPLHLVNCVVVLAIHVAQMDDVHQAIIPWMNVVMIL